VNAGDHRGGWRGQALETAQDGSITAARFEFPELWRWGRVELEDATGARAWGNPFALPAAPT